MEFYDREKELAVLEKAYARGGSDLVVVSGRRRVGKSRLIEEFVRGKKAVSIMVVPKEETQVARDIAEEIRGKYGYSPDFTSVRQALEYLFENNFPLVCMDEFPNVLSANPAIPYEVQRLWDVYKDKKNTMLVFSGSYAGMMNRLFTAKKAPLFNRATATIDVLPLPFWTVCAVLRKLGVSSGAEKIAFYSVFGGIPYYYVLLEKEGVHRLDGALSVLFFDAGAQLHEEGENILRQEFGNAYSKYYAILEAIHSGCVSMNEISQRLGVRSATLAKYMKALQREFRLVERTVPFGQSASKSRKGLYSITDNTLAFWFAHVYGKHSAPSKAEISTFLGRRFELFCRRFLEEHLERMGERIVRSGKWWGTIETPAGEFGPQEIDVVVETDKALYVGECKWTNSKVGQKELGCLKSTAGKAFAGARKPLCFTLFSKNGFSSPMEGAMLFDAESMVEEALLSRK